MNIFVGIAVVVVVLIAYALVRRPKQASNARPDVQLRTSPAQVSKFHAVSLRFPQSACEAAKAMESRRFLSSAAPRIPLAECDAQECKCRFVHHNDRREGDDRRDSYAQGFGASGMGAQEEEQRKRAERRDDPPEDIFK